jgi:transcriptional regulator with XRE-family HTH domain
MSTGDRIKEIRQKMGLSQSAFGVLLSPSSKRPFTPKATISAWERDRNEPNAMTIIVMEEKTGYSAKWILTGKEPRDAGSRYLQSFEENEMIKSRLDLIGKAGIKKIIAKYIDLI